MSTQESKSQAGWLAAERKTVVLVALIAMLRMFGLFALLPVLAIYSAELSGATPALIGIAVGGYGLTQAALQVPFGALSDRIGRRPVIWLGLALFALGSVVAGVSEHIHGVIAGRFLQGAGAVSATLAALLADATRAAVRTRSMAVLGIGIGSSFLAALVLGPVIAAATGVRSLFWLAASSALVAGVMVLLLPAGSSRPRTVAARRSLSSALRPQLLRLDAYVFVLHAILTAMFVALPFVLQNVLELPLRDHWQIYVTALAASLLGTVPLIVADERRGKAGVLTVAIALLIAGLSALSLASPSPVSVTLALALFFSGFNFLEAGLPARLSLLADERNRGAALGIFSSSQFLGAFAGGVSGGVLLASRSGNSVFLLCGVAAGLWLLIHLLDPQTG